MATGKKLVTLSGDSHNGWYSNLVAQDKSEVGKEIATSSVSSPGFEQDLGAEPASLAGFEQALALLVDDLNYLDASRRGYVLVKMSVSQIAAEWRYVSTILSPTIDTSLGHAEAMGA
ncbi:alkaline phosphatase D family protein [Dyadobacter crusticola]|uniref:alkaline phosphatase D family protein n=1 Tax=Dyadobacter crusticola TaxID=292407 RepID=UPI00146FA9DE|nr:alkaline phosphatase D family protein [Dyadobacter crusticola]